MRIFAYIEDTSIINKILAHLDAKSGTSVAVNQLPESRAPPQFRLVGGYRNEPKIELRGECVAKYIMDHLH